MNFQIIKGKWFNNGNTILELIINKTDQKKYNKIKH